MSDVWLKTVLSVILAVVSAFGAHSCRLEYVAAENEATKGRLVMTMMKEVCNPEKSHATTTEP